ncbi:hypothetical protein ACFRFH_13090 [Leifsonia sp. NPDC056824]|uniref:hypothetical protein n=1 Tax=Leifsonia sp. NPDC056824 TaxID=3345953 RepID=UPI00367C44CB
MRRLTRWLFASAAVALVVTGVSGPANAATPRGMVIGPASSAQLQAGWLYVQDTKVDGMRAGAEIESQNRLTLWSKVPNTTVWDTNGANGDSPTINVAAALGNYGVEGVFRVVTWTQDGANGPRKNVTYGPSLYRPYP